MPFKSTAAPHAVALSSRRNAHMAFRPPSLRRGDRRRRRRRPCTVLALNFDQRQLIYIRQDCKGFKWFPADYSHARRSLPVPARSCVRNPADGSHAYSLPDERITTQTSHCDRHAIPVLSHGRVQHFPMCRSPKAEWQTEERQRLCRPQCDRAVSRRTHASCVAHSFLSAVHSRLLRPDA